MNTMRRSLRVRCGAQPGPTTAQQHTPRVAKLEAGELRSNFNNLSKVSHDVKFRGHDAKAIQFTGSPDDRLLRSAAAARLPAQLSRSLEPRHRPGELRLRQA